MQIGAAAAARATLADVIGARLAGDGAASASSPARRVIGVVLGAALIAICAQAAIPFWPAPFTLQTFAVALVAATLGLGGGVGAVMLYLAAGLAGAPVFANGAFGPAVFAGPTAGYLLGFVPAAAAIGFFADRGMTRRLWTALPVFLLGDAIVLSCGTVWLWAAAGADATTLAATATTTALPYMPGAAIKSLAAALALPAAWRVLTR